MRALKIVTAAAAIALVAPSQAQAAYTISINSVLATGTSITYSLKNDPINCPPTGICPDVVRPYSVTLSQKFSGQEVDFLGGQVSLGGQNAARSFYTVDLVFQGSSLLRSSLSGQVFGQLNNPTDSFFQASNFAISVQDNATGEVRVLAPIPEPSTWAMMLLGFGAIGASMRRRRTAVRLLPQGG